MPVRPQEPGDSGRQRNLKVLYAHGSQKSPRASEPVIPVKRHLAAQVGERSLPAPDEIQIAPPLL